VIRAEWLLGCAGSPTQGSKKNYKTRGPQGVISLTFGFHIYTGTVYTSDRTLSPSLPYRAPGLHGMSSELLLSQWINELTSQAVLTMSISCKFPKNCAYTIV